MKSDPGGKGHRSEKQRFPHRHSMAAQYHYAEAGCYHGKALYLLKTEGYSKRLQEKGTRQRPAKGTGPEAERLPSAVQERALPEPAAEGVLKKLWKLLKYVICIM